MTPRPMMKCGHAANASYRRGDKQAVIRGDPRVKLTPNVHLPCCAICAPSKEAYEIDPSPPDLRTREARCCDCDARRPSSFDLPFFSYDGPGSPLDLDNATTHIPPKYRTKGGRPFDSFYCGCRGWD